MSAPKVKPAPRAVAVDLQTDAALVDLSFDVFKARVVPGLKVIEVTPRCRRIAVAELERWADENAEAVDPVKIGAPDVETSGTVCGESQRGHGREKPQHLTESNTTVRSCNP